MPPFAAFPPPGSVRGSRASASLATQLRKTCGKTRSATSPPARVHAGTSPEPETLFERAYESEFPHVYGYIRYRVGNGDTADDLTSQTFLKALGRLSTFEPERAQIAAWILGIARNVVRDHLRARRRWGWRPLEWLRSRTSTGLRMPTGLHRGEPIRFDHADVAPGGIVLTFFGSGANELLLAAFPVGEGRSVGFSRMENRTAPDGRTVFENPELKTEEVSVGGQLVVWDPDPWDPGPGRSDGSALRWEEEGVSYSLMGRSLTREEAVDLFLSLRPLDEPP